MKNSQCTCCGSKTVEPSLKRCAFFTFREDISGENFYVFLITTTNFDENIHKASPSTVLGLLTCSAEKQIKQNFSPDIRVFLSITSSIKRSSGLREKEKSADKEFGGQAVLVSFRGSLKNNDLSVRNIGKSQVVLITAVLVLC